MEELKRIWKKVSEALTDEMSAVAYDSWIKPITPEAIDEDKITIKVPFSVNKNMIMTKYLSLIESCVEAVTSRKFDIEVVVDDEDSGSVGTDPITVENTLNPKYTFSSFVVGNNNNLAYVASLAVAERPAKTYNPLFLYGGSGLGKTHLSTSIAKVLIERGFDVVYDSAQNIISDFEYERFGRGYGDMSDSRTDKYFDCDMLIIDDLGTEMANQFTVSCLYNIINTRINHSKSMIISTNLAQNEIRERYTDRITSRLFGDFMVMKFTGKDIRLQKLS